MNFSILLKRAGQFTTTNSPTILTIVGVVGTVTTAYLAAKATWTAATDVGFAEHNQQTMMTPKERVEFIRNTGLWKEYIPPIVVGCATIACVIGANRVGVRRIAATAAAGTIVERAFDEYKAKVKEKFGERKEDALHTEIAQDRVNANPPSAHFLEEVQLANAPDRKLCYDLYSGLFFASSVQKMERTVNEFNSDMLKNGYGCLGDLYRMLDIDLIPRWAEEVGWNADRLVEIKIDTTLVHETEPCLTLNFRNDPHQDYSRPFLSRY